MGDSNKKAHIKKEDTYENVEEQQINCIKKIIEDAGAKAIQNKDLPDNEWPSFAIEIPSNVEHGDFAVNIAMVSAKVFGMAPRQIAQALVQYINVDEESLIESVTIAGPGFINLFLKNKLYTKGIISACVRADDYGKTDFGKKEKVNIEFVSANPTGPMHLGNARGGVLGDCLAESMIWAGYDVTREFYINDAGNQIKKFGKSLAVRYLQIVHGDDFIEFPEDGYHGDDIKELAFDFYNIHGKEFAQKSETELEQALIDYALPKNIEEMQKHLEKYRVTYDVWFRESSLYENNAVQDIIEKMTERGFTYKKEGATWYKATEFGAEKDEVLVRANGIPTYFAADIAYHLNKMDRGFTKLIDVWGADHHGHVARIKGALNALGKDGDSLNVVLMQLVRLVRGKELVRMSKRTGKAITLVDLLDEVPVDSARFFFNMREPGSTVEFDLDLAVKEDSDNPVYYVQYAHARICSILRNLEQEGIYLNEDIAFEQTFTMPEEKALIRKISSFSNEIINSAKNYDPARLTRYVMEVANLFHKFYATCRVKGEPEPTLQFRLALCIATKNTIANALHMMKITVPEKM